MAAKTAFLLANYQLRVSRDWVVDTTVIEPVTPTKSNPVPLLSSSAEKTNRLQLDVSVSPLLMQQYSI